MTVDLHEVSKAYENYRITSLYVDSAVDLAESIPALLTEIRQLRIELERAEREIQLLRLTIKTLNSVTVVDHDWVFNHD